MLSMLIANTISAFPFLLFFVHCLADFVIYVTLGITTWGSLNVDNSTEWVTYFTVQYKKTETLDKWHDVTASTGLPQVRCIS